MSNTISVTVSGESLSEVTSKLEQLHKSLSLKGEVVEAAPSATTSAAPTTATTAKRGAGRPTNAEKEAAEKAAAAAKSAEVKSPEIDPFDTGAPATKTYTADDAFKALQLVNAKKQIPGVQEVLAKFKCARLSELKAEDYAQFIDACEKAAA